MLACTCTCMYNTGTSTVHTVVKKRKILSLGIPCIGFPMLEGTACPCTSFRAKNLVCTSCLFLYCKPWRQLRSRESHANRPGTVKALAHVPGTVQAQVLCTSIVHPQGRVYQVLLLGYLTMAPPKSKSTSTSSSKSSKKQTTINSFFSKATITSPIRSAPKVSLFNVSSVVHYLLSIARSSAGTQ